MVAIHKAFGEWTQCGLKVKPTLKVVGSFDNLDDAMLCKNCIRRSGDWIHAEELDYILKTMLDIFTSLMHDEDLELFKKEHPGLKWKLGFEEAIIEFADRRSGKELMTAYLIHSIKRIEAREDKKGGT